MNDGDSPQPSSKLTAMEPQFLDTPQGRRLAYHVLPGSAPGVVFIHGFATTMCGQKSTALHDYCRRLGKAYVCFDLSGHGASSGTLREGTVTAWLEDLSAVIDALTQGPQVRNSHTCVVYRAYKLAPVHVQYSTLPAARQ